jgi:hypothetical protein
VFFGAKVGERAAQHDTASDRKRGGARRLRRIIVPKPTKQSFRPCRQIAEAA